MNEQRVATTRLFAERGRFMSCFFFLGIVLQAVSLLVDGDIAWWLCFAGWGGVVLSLLLFELIRGRVMTLIALGVLTFHFGMLTVRFAWMFSDLWSQG